VSWQAPTPEETQRRPRPTPHPPSDQTVSVHVIEAMATVHPSRAIAHPKPAIDPFARRVDRLDSRTSGRCGCGCSHHCRIDAIGAVLPVRLHRTEELFDELSAAFSC